MDKATLKCYSFNHCFLFQAYFLLALTFTVAQAVSHGFRNIPQGPLRNFNAGQYQTGPLSYSFPQQGPSGRRDVTDNIHYESGNLYSGRRDGRFLTRDGRSDSYRDLQYSVGPQQRDFRGPQGPNPYQQQGIRRYQDADSFGYGASRNPQISYSAPHANTRSYNPRLDATGNPQNEYSRFY
ncbi:uncharacterized protein TNCT_295901 [Trichonephila clavata]|uniref:Uncharacterized protein n=1 Tax=Trichonephila clavata TaxID=2740835 RepID=A0A8X6GYJ9_TRICU|nr:uncharacterized protein TNCT_295901 [Trichonephila clavata]